MDSVTAFIPGHPEQQGSKRHVGHGVMIEDNPRLKSWRRDAILCLLSAAEGFKFGRVPIEVTATFRYARPKSHYGTGRNSDRLKPSAPSYKTSPSDCDKLCRALGDAATQSGLIPDDAFIVRWVATKGYGDEPGVTVTFKALGN